MGFLSTGFNAITRLHSAPGWLKRPGSPDIYSPIRTTPSNYFRMLAGPSHTVVTGSECIIPVATIYGQQTVAGTLDVVPTAGTWTIAFSLNGVPVITGALAFDAVQADIQAALRLIAGCESVTVAGSLQTLLLTINFVGVKQVSGVVVALGALVGTTTVTYAYTPIAWPTEQVRRGDRIINSDGTFTITEVVPMPDIGGATMGYRARYE